jgi:hypothetical protein
MPVHQLVDRKARLLAFHFFRDVTHAQIEHAVRTIAKHAEPAVDYRNLLAFHSTTDPSGITNSELYSIQDITREVFDYALAHRAQGAIVVAPSLDTKIIMPLWKAMSETGRQTDIHYRYFIEIGPALA